MVITSRERDLGGFSVHRVLPYATHRMVGPFIFFDHMGPAEFGPGEGIDVKPHPHINLATVTYLFEGVIRHRDSLGSDQLIEPGAVNWMSAGRGIVHSERTPDFLKNQSRRLNGIQCWLALPEEFEEIEPEFVHHPSTTLPEFEVGGVWIKLLAGELFGQKSPVQIYSDLFYAEARLQPTQILEIETNGRDCAVYVVAGEALVEGSKLNDCSMAVAKPGDGLKVEALAPCRVMILGGSPVGPRKIFWNLVSSSSVRIEEAKKEWAVFGNGPTPRFKPIPGDDQEFIPLPEGSVKNPKGTIM